jgi:hypothetical protein
MSIKTPPQIVQNGRVARIQDEEIAMRTSVVVLAWTLAALPVLFCSCVAGGSPHDEGRRLVIFVDQSASIDQAQRCLWQADADRLTELVGGGWAVTIYGIHDRTLDAAPLFDAEVPAWSEDATFDIARAQKAALVQVRRDAAAALHAALQVEGGASRTDLFAGIDRIRSDTRRRPTTIVYFSDMLNSTSDFDMERANLLIRGGFSDAIQRLAERHRWRPDTLAGDDIYCVLNSIESGRRPPAVDRLTQRSFYERLFSTLGAHLAVYDTHLGNLGMEALTRGDHVAKAQ